MGVCASTTTDSTKKDDHYDKESLRVFGAAKAILRARGEEGANLWVH
jgi:hypothetical protein